MNPSPPGRKPVPVAEKLQVMPIRLNAEQKAKLGRLGGAAWVRQQIDRAKEAPRG
jgi:hypothetical protein